MLTIFKNSSKILNVVSINIAKSRTFLSHAYYCNEVWGQRLQDPILQKVNLDELYNDLDQQYQKTKNISAVDVDVFANKVNDESYVDELLDLIHKLRLSADTCNTLNSTSHAVIRSLTNFDKTEQLLSILDDRLNYGIFLDNFTANLLLNTFWKKKDYTSGARIASQLMLQEDFGHSICTSLSLIHCFKYLSNPTEWPQPPKPQEPEEEVKIRIKYVRNPYNDEHFDLTDPNKIVGKTLMEITRPFSDPLNCSFYLLGVTLFKPDNSESIIEKFASNDTEIYKNVLNLLPNDKVHSLPLSRLQMTEPPQLEELLENNVHNAVNNMSEKDIALQCQTYVQWEKERQEALECQRQRFLMLQRLGNIDKSQQQLKEKEMLLWFFENEEQIELEIERKKQEQETNKDKLSNKKKQEKESEYVPPEVYKRRDVVK